MFNDNRIDDLIDDSTSLRIPDRVDFNRQYENAMQIREDAFNLASTILSNDDDVNWKTRIDDIPTIGGYEAMKKLRHDVLCVFYLICKQLPIEKEKRMRIYIDGLTEDSGKKTPDVVLFSAPNNHFKIREFTISDRPALAERSKYNKYYGLLQELTELGYDYDFKVYAILPYEVPAFNNNNADLTKYSRVVRYINYRMSLYDTDSELRDLKPIGERREILEKPQLPNHFVPFNTMQNFVINNRLQDPILDLTKLKLPTEGKLKMSKQITDLEEDYRNHFDNSTCMMKNSIKALKKLPLILSSGLNLSDDELMEQIMFNSPAKDMYREIIMFTRLMFKNPHKLSLSQQAKVELQFNSIHAKTRKENDISFKNYMNRWKNYCINFDIDPEEYFPRWLKNEVSIIYNSETCFNYKDVHPLIKDNQNYRNIFDHVNKMQFTQCLDFLQNLCVEVGRNSPRMGKKGWWCSRVPNTNTFVYYLTEIKISTNERPIFMFLATKDLPIIDQYMTLDWITINECHYSEIFSLDVMRLSWYQRIKDRSILNYFSYLQLVGQDKSMTLYDCFKEDRSMTYEITCLIDYSCSQPLSEFLQQTRYTTMCLLGFMSSTIDISKLNTPIRNWLHLYLLKRHLKNLRILCEKPTNDLWTYESGSWKIRFQRPLIPDYENGLNCMLYDIYLCMLYEKDRGDIFHNSRHLLDKIVEKQNSFDEDPYHYNDEEEKIMYEPITGHFSKSFIYYGVEELKEHLLGTNYSDEQSMLYSKTTNPDISELFTTKSSLPKESTQTLTREQVLRGDRLRSKCLMTGIDYTKEFKKSKLWEYIPHLSENRIVSDVFDKNQIGGTREIHILDFESRVKQRIIEGISRFVCERIENEMLTKGASKYAHLMQKIKNLRNRMPNSRIIHFNLDRTRWGPNHNVDSFIAMFECLFSNNDYLKNLTCNILKQWRDKVVFIPPKKVLEGSYNNNPEQTEFVNSIGMWQGILHFTSSLYHCVAMKGFIKQLKTLLPGYKRIWDIDFVVSSDDCYICLAVSNNKMRHERRNIAKIVYEIQRTVMYNYNIIMSKKDSVSEFIGEFNSSFFTSFEFVNPLIKFSIACSNIEDTDSYGSMVESSYRLICQYKESGAINFNVALAHSINKNFIDYVYCTNSVNKLNMVRSFTLGNYPYLPIPIGEIMGPKLYDTINRNNQDVRKTYNNAKFHKIFGMIADDIDLYSRVEPYCTTFASHRLMNFRRKINITRETIVEDINNNFEKYLMKTIPYEQQVYLSVLPIWSVRFARSFNEYPTAMKLGRIGAAYSAKVFSIDAMDMLEDSKTEKLTWIEAANKILSDENKGGEPPNILFATKICASYVDIHTKTERTYTKFLMRKAQVKPYSSDLRTSILDVFKYLIGENHDYNLTAIREDIRKIEQHYPNMLSENVLNQINNSNGLVKLTFYNTLKQLWSKMISCERSFVMQGSSDTLEKFYKNQITQNTDTGSNFRVLRKEDNELTSNDFEDFFQMCLIINKLEPSNVKDLRLSDMSFNEVINSEDFDKFLSRKDFSKRHLLYCLGSAAINDQPLSANLSRKLLRALPGLAFWERKPKFGKDTMRGNFTLIVMSVRATAKIIGLDQDIIRIEGLNITPDFWKTIYEVMKWKLNLVNNLDLFVNYNPELIRNTMLDIINPFQIENNFTMRDETDDYSNTIIEMNGERIYHGRIPMRILDSTLNLKIKIPKGDNLKTLRICQTAQVKPYELFRTKAHHISLLDYLRSKDDGEIMDYEDLLDWVADIEDEKNCGENGYNEEFDMDELVSKLIATTETMMTEDLDVGKLGLDPSLFEEDAGELVHDDEIKNDIVNNKFELGGDIFGEEYLDEVVDAIRFKIPDPFISISDLSDENLLEMAVLYALTSKTKNEINALVGRLLSLCQTEKDLTTENRRLLCRFSVWFIEKYLDKINFSAVKSHIAPFNLDPIVKSQHFEPKKRTKGSRGFRI